MMAWRLDEEHILYHISDQCSVSSLIGAFFELMLLLCLFLCAIVSVTTTRLIKSSGLLYQPCASCDKQPRHSTQQSDFKGFQTLGRLADPPTPNKIICEDCTRIFSDCGCTLKPASVVDNDSSPGRYRCYVLNSGKNNEKCNPVDYCGSDHTIVWAIDDDTDDSSHRKQRRGESCKSSSENVESSWDDGSSERIVIDETPVEKAYGCERCMGIPLRGSYSPPSRRCNSRAIKGKFAEVFSNENYNTASRVSGSCFSCCCDHHPTHVFADNASLIISDEGPEIRESAEEDNGLRPMLLRDGPSSRFLSDGSAGRDLGRFTPEDSARDSSQVSFSYRKCSSPTGSSSHSVPYVSRNRLKLSIDTDLLGGESSTPEWCESLSSPSPTRAVGDGKDEDVVEEGSAVQLERNRDICEMELREALHEEREALNALYLELEEERNAASSAAHETMAMITRLQEEKAAIQMEARQYQRMAEEKQQYDQESMAMLQEILVRRDHDLYALEEEVNQYRNKLLTLGMDRSIDDGERVGSPNTGSDVLVIERETLLLESSEHWKNRTDRRDEKLLGQIKDWLREASEKLVVPVERIDERNVPGGNFPKLSDHIHRLLPGNGKKNLLESFSSVAVEDTRKDGIVTVDDSPRDGIVKEEFETHRDGVANEECEARWEGIINEEAGTHKLYTAAGYESFQGMMESLRREPSMRDEESLQTLKKIEEKFHRQSSLGEIRRSGDELREIWKSTLRSFESDECEDGEAHGAETEGTELRSQSPIAAEPANTGDSPDHPPVVIDTSADADRSIGEKRMSVLEYVSKFEEQLHQLGNNKPPPPQPGKLGLATIVDSVADARPQSKEASPEVTDFEKSRKSSFDGDRPIPIKTRLRKRRAADSRNATPDAERDRFVVRGDGSPSSGDKATRKDGRFASGPDFEESNPDGSSVIHDVYEVQKDPRQPIPEVIDREDKRFSHDIKKYVSSTVNELVPGQFIDSHETAHCVEHYLFDSSRPDFFAGHTLEEYESNGKIRPDQDCSTGRVRHSVKEAGMCAHAAAIWPGELMDISRGSDGCALQSPSSAVTDSPRTQMRDVVRQLVNRLKVLETDRQMMQDTIASLKRENGEMGILQDAAQQLRELQRIEHTAVTGTNAWPPDDPAFLSSIKGMLSLDTLRQSVQFQLSKLVQLFLGDGDPGGSQENQEVGIFRLLHKSLLSEQQKPIERARSLQAVYATNNSPLDDQVHPSISTPKSLVSQHSWPMNARERSETAFSGWDY